MRAVANNSAAMPKKKRAVNLTLNEALVVQAKTFTGNLSATMEALLADYVAQQQQVRLSRQQAADACVEYWNQVHAAEGSFADEQSTLYDGYRRGVVVPLRRRAALPRQPAIAGSRLNPVFRIERIDVMLHPLDLVSVAVEQLGARVGSLAEHGQAITDALDELLTRPWG